MLSMISKFMCVNLRVLIFLNILKPRINIHIKEIYFVFTPEKHIRHIQKERIQCRCINAYKKRKI